MLRTIFSGAQVQSVPDAPLDWLGWPSDPLFRVLRPIRFGVGVFLDGGCFSLLADTILPMDKCSSTTSHGNCSPISSSEVTYYRPKWYGQGKVLQADIYGQT